jgi:uncharacterized protein (TIGR03435 family)
MWLLFLVMFTAMKNRSARLRYALSTVALAALVALPIVTLVVLYVRAVPIDMPAVSIGASRSTTVEGPQMIPSIALSPDLQTTAWLVRLQALALPTWLCGMVLFSLRLLRGMIHVVALGRQSAADDSVCEVVDRLARRMGVGRSLRVLISDVDAPSVVGWLRLKILLPSATLIGLAPKQLEAVLAHELAHAKRHVYVVNLLQVVAETLLFYHPAVWWTSARIRVERARIRVERELCCDDLAVGSRGDARCYARALTTLKEIRVTTPSMAIRRPAVVAVGLGLTCVGLLVNLSRVQAQAPQAAALPTFEVASVKLNKSGELGTQIRLAPGGRLTATNATLRSLIAQAYGTPQPLPNFRITGAPKWVDSDRFDIVATAGRAQQTDVNGVQSESFLMLRTLLAERFKLVTHNETREQSIYGLITTRSEGLLGPQLRTSNVDCAALLAAQRGGPPPAPPAPGERPTCGQMGGFGRLSAGAITMTQLANILSARVNQVVVDKTGLMGRFDLELQWTPEQPPPPPFPGVPPPPPVDPNGPSIFTAVQEQLGLKLNSQKGPVEVLVIDSVDHPTED